MNRRVLVCLTAVLFSLTAIAQQSSTANVPRQLRFGGTIKSADGTPRTGVVGVMFSLYAEQQGGTALWTELQNAQLDANGQYTVLLGSQHSDGVPAELFTANEARWLGIQVEAEPEQPRVLLVSVPYALKAGDAETLGGRPFSDFVLSSPAGTSTVKTTSTAGTVQPSSVNTSTSGGTAGYVARWSDASTLANSQLTDDGNNVRLTTNGSKLYFSTPSGNPPYFSGNLDSQLDVLGATGGTRWLNNAGAAVNMVLLDNGNVGVGTGAPAVKLDVNGNTNVYGNIKLTASNGQLQFNTPTGNAPYFSGNLDSQLDVRGAAAGTRWLNNAGSAVNLVLLDNGNMGVGIGAPAAKLDVNGNVIVRSGGITFPNASVQTTAGVTGVNGSLGVNGSIGNSLLTLTADTSYVQRRVTGTCATGNAIASVGADGSVACQTVSGGSGSLSLPYANSGADNPPTTQGVFKITDTTNGPANTQQGAPDPNAIPTAVVGVATGTGITAGVVGKATGPDGLGVVALSSSATGGEVPLMLSWSQATSGKVTLFNGMASSPESKGIELNFAVPTSRQIISANVGPDNSSTTVFSVNGDGSIYSGGSIQSNGNLSTNGTIQALTGNPNTYFDLHPDGTLILSGNLVSNGTGTSSFSGDVFFNGTLHKPGGSFTIDHPLDPANKILNHSFVESPDMMNIYNGIVALDQHGQAWVQLPDWFEALNGEFRYQLTAIGAPGPRLYIAQKISGNRFRIAGGKRGMEVSWQVTGIRHDAWAEAHRIPVEEEKTGAQHGTYLHPELFGSSKSYNAGLTGATPAQNETAARPSSRQ
jgi:hypothetical protein